MFGKNFFNLFNPASVIGVPNKLSDCDHLPLLRRPRLDSQGGQPNFQRTSPLFPLLGGEG